MNSRQLLEIANRAIATGGIAPPSEVLEIAKFVRRYVEVISTETFDVPERFPYGRDPNTRDYAD